MTISAAISAVVDAHREARLSAEQRANRNEYRAALELPEVYRDLRAHLPRYCGPAGGIARLHMLCDQHGHSVMLVLLPAPGPQPKRGDLLPTGTVTVQADPRGLNDAPAYLMLLRNGTGGYHDATSAARYLAGELLNACEP